MCKHDRDPRFGRISASLRRFPPRSVSEYSDSLLAPSG